MPEALPEALPDDDPQPQPPVQPDLNDCCQSGCDPCIFDLYDEALARYRIALAEWRARHPEPATAQEPQRARQP